MGRMGGGGRSGRGCAVRRGMTPARCPRRRRRHGRPDRRRGRRAASDGGRAPRSRARAPPVLHAHERAPRPREPPLPVADTGGVPMQVHRPQYGRAAVPSPSTQTVCSRTCSRAQRVFAVTQLEEEQMTHRRLTIALALTFSALALPAARADGGPSPGVTLGWDGLVAPGGAGRYVALPAGAAAPPALLSTPPPPAHNILPLPR